MRARHAPWLVALNQEVADLPIGQLLPVEQALSSPQHALYLALSTFLSRVDPDAELDRKAIREALYLIQEPLRFAKAAGQALSRALGVGDSDGRALALGHLAREVSTLGLRGGTLPLVEAAIVRARRSELKRYGVMASKFTNEIGVDLKRQLVLGVLRRESFHQVTKRVAGQLYRKMAGGSDAQTLSLAIYRRARNRAERIVRSEIISAYNSAATLGIKELAATDPKLKKKWVAALDYRTCSLCRELDGTVVDVGAEFPFGVTTLAHACCRCVVVMVRD